MTIVIHNCLNIKVNLPEFTVRPNPNFPILDNDKYVYVKVCVCVYFVFVCVCVCVCLTLDGLKAEHEFRVWVSILGRMSRHFHFYNAICICAVILLSIKYIINYNSCYITYN